MLAKVDASLPKSLGDLERARQDGKKTKKKDGAPAETSAVEGDEETLPIPPVNIRYLGKNLDLIA